MRKSGLAVIALALLGVPATHAAESLIVGLTSDYVRISSSFTGTELVLFGAVEATDDVISGEGRDFVIVVRGPTTPMTIRRKQRIGGIWVNATAVRFEALPGFYHIASTRPLAEIAAPAVLRRYQLGPTNLSYVVDNGDAIPRSEMAEYETAAVRLNGDEGLYAQSVGAIQLSGGSLFQTRVAIPASVPVGSFRAEVYLFRNGQVISAYSAPIYVDKSGIERWLHGFAHEQTILYGLAAVVLAMMIGWLAATLFRER